MTRQQARRARGLSVADVAATTDVPILTVYRFEAGQNVRLNDAQAALMSVIYGVSPDVKIASGNARQRLLAKLVATDGASTVCVTSDKPWLFRAALALVESGEAILMRDEVYTVRKGPRIPEEQRRKVRKLVITWAHEVVTPPPTADEIRSSSTVAKWLVNHDW